MAGERHRLRDGSAIEVRPVAAGDAEALKRAFARLSADSRRRRFLAPKARLSEMELRYFTAVDHHRHEALIGLAPGNDGAIVGVARFIRLDDEPQAAEAAITVADEWQRRGVATVLLQALRARARAEGVDTFYAEVLPENEQRIRSLFGRVGELSDRRGALPVRMRFALHDDAEGHDPAAGLRAAAGGAIRVMTSALPGVLRPRR